MGAVQLWLLERPRLLQERLGERWSRAVPKAAGVYVMAGGGEALYVGKSKNLRRRLGGYNSVYAGRCSRKTLRLVSLVESVTWEECRDEEEALLRENELIRLLQPRFNRANTWPQGYWYVGLECGVRGYMRLCLRHERVPEGEWYGAFRGSRGFGALVRWLWWFQRPNGESLPAALLRGRLPRSVGLVLGEAADWFRGADPGGLVRRFLAGRSDELLRVMKGLEAGRLGGTGFERSVLRGDLDILEAFWRTGPARNAVLRDRFGIRDSWIEKEELDDLLIMHGKGPRQEVVMGEGMAS